MIRNDGVYTIYWVEYLHPKFKHWYRTAGLPKGSYGEKDDFFITLNHCSHDHGSLKGKNSKLHNEFTECGDCWQKTGVEGTFNRDIAVNLMTELAKSNSGVKFKVVKLEINQSREEIATIQL